jgi:heme/copper-type cytochrome/quinol oxidase subunit 2
VDRGRDGPFIGLTFMGYTVWAGAVRRCSQNRARATGHREVTGQQFVGTCESARTASSGRWAALIDDSLGNPLGIDRSGAGGKDGVIVPRMTVPVNKRSRSSCAPKMSCTTFVPELRLKLDTVPGIESRLRFKPGKVGAYGRVFGLWTGAL